MYLLADRLMFFAAEVPLDWTSLIQYGALGVIVFLFITGMVMSTRGPAFKLLTDQLTLSNERAAHAEADKAAMQTAMISQVIPALVLATDALKTTQGFRRKEDGTSQ